MAVGQQPEYSSGWTAFREQNTNLALVLNRVETARRYDEGEKRDLAKQEKKAKGGKTGAGTTSPAISTPPPPL